MIIAVHPETDAAHCCVSGIVGLSGCKPMNTPLMNIQNTDLLLRDLIEEHTAVKLLNDTCVLPKHFSHVGDHSCCF